MSALGSLVVKLALEYAEYTKGLSKSDQDSLKFAQNVQRHFDSATGAAKEFFIGVAKGAAGAAVAYLGVSSAVEAFNRSLNELAELDDMAQKTGASVENLSKLQKVAATFGQDFGEVDGALTKLAKGLAGVDDETSKTHKALAALGVSSKDTAGNLRDPSEVLVDVARKLQDYEDGAGKAALMNDLFGKSGANLLPYLNDVAEHIDKFKGASAEAAAQAARLQDQMGFLRTGANDLFQKVAIDLLPTFNDFIGAITDTKTAGDALANDVSLTSWADDLALGLARVFDVASTIPAAIRAIGGSFEVVKADLELLNYIKENANPIAAIKMRLDGKSPQEEMQKAWDKRNAIVEGADKRYSDLWNTPANRMEQAMLNRIAGRRTSGEEAMDALSGILGGGAGPKKKLPYGGKDGKDGKDAKEELSDYEKLNRSISEKIALQNAEAVAATQLSEAEKIRSKISADLEVGAIKLTAAEQGKLQANLFLLDVIEMTNDAQKVAREQTDKEVAAAKQSVDAALKEAEANETLAATFGMTKGEIEAMELAQLEYQYSQRESDKLTEAEIKTLEKLIAAKRRSANALASVDWLEEQKKAASESQKVWERFGENVQRNMGDVFFNAMQGKFDGIGASFRAMLQRMLADAMAANLSKAMFGGGGSDTGWIGALANASSAFFGSSVSVDTNGTGLTNGGASLGSYGLGAGRASGGPVYPGTLHPVNELGPELLSVGGKDYLMMGAQGGYVTPNNKLGGKSVTVNMYQTNNIDSRADREGIARDLAKVKEATVAEVRDMFDRGDL